MNPDDKHQVECINLCVKLNQQTYAMIKPDAVSGGHVSEIIKAINESGQFTIIQSKYFTFTSESASYFYEEHKDRDFFQKLQEFMVSGKCFCMVLEGPNAIKNWRKMIGPTSVSVAKETSPTSLRAIYGDTVDICRNACHGSDSEISAEREIKFIFPVVRHIFYTGIGCKNNYEHTEEEFIEIMNKYVRKFNEYPSDYKNFTLDDWIDYSGGEIVEE